MNVFSWTQGSVSYSLHMYRFATVFRVVHTYGCCLLLSLNSSLPRNARPAPARGSTVFSRQCTAEPGHNACVCPLKSNVPGLSSGMSCHATADAHTFKTSHPSKQNGCWAFPLAWFESQSMPKGFAAVLERQPSPDQGAVSGNWPFLPVLDRAGLGFYLII